MDLQIKMYTTSCFWLFSYLSTKYMISSIFLGKELPPTSFACKRMHAHNVYKNCSRSIISTLIPYRPWTLSVILFMEDTTNQYKYCTALENDCSHVHINYSPTLILTCKRMDETKTKWQDMSKQKAYVDGDNGGIFTHSSCATLLASILVVNQQLILEIQNGRTAI